MGQEEKGLGKGNQRKMCMSAELLQPNQALSWAMGQHMTYLCCTGGIFCTLCWYWRIFAEERANCQVNFAVAGDEVKQSPIMLGCSANCSAEVFPPVQDYWCVIQSKSSVMRGRDFSGEERHCVPFLCPEKVELPQRGERVGTAHGVVLCPDWGQVTQHHHCYWIAYSKK